MDEHRHRPGCAGRRTWRGPAWVNVARLLAPATRSLGLGRAADGIAPAACAAVACNRLREHDDPLSGRVLGARGFSWSALAADHEAPRRRAGAS